MMKPTYDEILAALAKMTDRYHRAILATGALDWVACAATEDAIALIARVGATERVQVPPAPPVAKISNDDAAPIPLSGPVSINRNTEIVARYKKGEPAAALGRAYGLSSQRIHQILKNPGPPKKMPRNSAGFTELQAKVIALRESGMECAEVTRALGFESYGYVRTVLRKFRPDLLSRAKRSAAQMNGTHSDQPTA